MGKPTIERSDHTILIEETRVGMHTKGDPTTCVLV